MAFERAPTNPFDVCSSFMVSLVEASQAVSSEALSQLAEVLLKARESGRRVYVMGNGGSASTATHFCCDLIKTARVAGHAPFRAFSLTDNIALMTAWANDAEFKVIFSEQITALVDPDDVVIAISASGKSPNIIAGLTAAKEIGAKTVSLVGFDGGPAMEMADVAIHVPSHDYGVVESVHLGIAHSVTAAIYSALKGTKLVPSGFYCASVDAEAVPTSEAPLLSL